MSESLVAWWDPAVSSPCVVRLLICVGVVRPEALTVLCLHGGAVAPLLRESIQSLRCRLAWRPEFELKAMASDDPKSRSLVFCLSFLTGCLPGLAVLGCSPPMGVSSRVSAPLEQAAPPHGPIADLKDSYWVEPDSAYKPYGNSVQGLITFRGNPMRNYYGAGHIPEAKPRVRWVYPREGTMCSVSYLGGKGDTWCGLGWTGQPSVFMRENKLLLAFGGFDKAIHLLDAETGKDALPPLVTGDIIKGSSTVDPDGYPLLYIGSRDNNLRVVSFDSGRLKQLWKLNAYDVKPVLWDDDWDASPLILRDFLLVGGENGHFHVVKLNRSYTQEGSVVVRPELMHHVPGWDAQLLRDFPKPAVSIENSVAVYKNMVYFANSAGLLQGWDLSPVLHGKPPIRVYRLWLGDDTDASITIDENGHLYVASEFEIGNQRSREVGQLLKINPNISGDGGIVWRKKMTHKKPGGIWSTPALTPTQVIATTDDGKVMALNRETGATLWQIDYGVQPLWSSPVVIDNRLLVATCNGYVDAYRLNGSSRPHRLWSLKVANGCFEATAAVWNGKIFIGNRDGKLYALW